MGIAPHAPAARQTPWWITSWMTRLALVVAALAVAAILMLTWARMGAASRISQLHAEIEKTDPHWRFEDAVREAAKLPDAENGALFLLKIVANMPKPHELSKEHQDLFKNRAMEQVLNVPQREALLEWHTKMAPTLRELEGAWKYERGAFPVTLDPLPFFSPSKAYDVLMPVLYLLNTHAMLQADNQDIDGVMRTGLLLLHLGKMSASPDAAYFRVSTRHAALGAFRRALSQGEPSEEMLRQADTALRKEWEYLSSQESLKVSRGLIGQTYVHLQNGNLTEDDVISRLKLQTPTAWRLTYSRTRDYLATLELSEGAIRAMDRPPWEWITAVRALEEKHLQTTWSLLAVITSISIGPGLVNGLALHLECDADKECLLTSIAAERFRKKHHRWPANMQELVSDAFLPSIPRNPFSGSELKFRPHDRGITISCENNGTGQSRDVEHQLWNVDIRRRTD